MKVCGWRMQGRISISAENSGTDDAQACHEDIRLLHKMLLARVYPYCILLICNGGCRGASAGWPSVLVLIM